MEKDPPREARRRINKQTSRAFFFDSLTGLFSPHVAEGEEEEEEEDVL